jgi:hypothetical protein
MPIEQLLDVTGELLRKGQVVRIIGVPDLSDMNADSRAEILPVFEHLVGKYKRIDGFGEHGHVEFFFRIAKGPHAGYHSVLIEPEYLRVRRSRTA